MFGLALSMGASSLVLPHHDDGATAAEPKGTEATAPSVSQIATLPSSTPEMATLAPAITVVEHVVREGQTLSQIARSYRVNVQEIIAANHLATDALIKPGQTLKIPVNRQLDASAKVVAPELLASADLNQMPLAETAGASPAAERDTALSRLHEQRNKLRDSLAGLRSEELNGETDQKTNADSGAAEKVDITVVPPAIQPNAAQANAAQVSAKPQTLASSILPPQVAEAVSSPTTLPASTVQPSVQQQVAFAPQPQAYRVSRGDTVAEIARLHNIPQSVLINANRLSDPNVIFVGQVLQLPNAQPANPVIATAQAEAQPVAILPTANPSAVTPVRAVPTLPDDRTKVNSTEQPTAVQSSASPQYVDNLLAEVRALRAKHQGEVARPATVEQSTVEQSTVEQSSRDQARVEQPTMIARNTVPAATPVGLVSARPPYANRTAVPASSSLVAATQPVATQPVAAQPAVVAVAPIGAENYAPLRQPITGRPVSPDLPPLADADSYLPEGMASNGYIWPARGMLTSGYGWRWGRMHQGIDIAADVGTPIYAAANGVVAYSDWNSGGYGNMVDIRHPDGSVTRYAHLNRNLVQPGQRVRQGEQIAEMGSTGYSTGPHLHFEVRPAGEGAVNPIAYLPGR
jgi:murein DD-endopeptidase MepM/ murein hydrolase activator NlpD